jgi:hypothetical protein
MSQWQLAQIQQVDLLFIIFPSICFLILIINPYFKCQFNLSAIMRFFRSIFLGLFLFLVYLPGVSQPDVGLYVGLSNSKLVGDGPSLGSFKYTRGFIGSAHIDFKLSESVRFSLQPGFKTGGAKVAFADTISQETRDSLKINLLTFSLPLMLKVTSFNEKVYFAGGFSVDFPVSAKVDNGVEKIDISTEINKINVNALFALGYRIPVHSTVAYIELRYLQGLVNLSNRLNEEDAYLPRVKTSAIQLLFGWQFPIRENK